MILQLCLNLTAKQPLKLTLFKLAVKSRVNIIGPQAAGTGERDSQGEFQLEEMLGNPEGEDVGVLPERS